MSEQYQAPRKEDGTVDLPRVAAHLSLRAHHLYTTLANTSEICRDIHDLLPKRGEVVDLFVELVEVFAGVEAAFLDLDMDLLDVATQFDWNDEDWMPTEGEAA